MSDVESQTGGMITKSWLSRAERGDIGHLEQQQLRLISLARIYGAPAEIMFALGGLDIPLPQLPDEETAEWLREILQNPVAISALHKVWKLPPPARDRAFTLLSFSCDWLSESLEEYREKIMEVVTHT